jgi:molecular chaperone GrpE
MDWTANNGAEPEIVPEHELPSGEGEQPASPPSAADLAALEAELAKTKAERDALLERLARLQAEFDNARKRAAREQQDFRDFALTEAIKILLPILDSFDRALHSHVSPKDFKAGVELINRQFHDALAKLGVTPVEAEGAPFDPAVHEAIEMVPTDQAEDNHVLQELQRGYKLKGRLLRPAMVRVAHNPKS